MSDFAETCFASIRQIPEAGARALTGAERHQILEEWNRTEREYPRDKCIHQVFEEQARRAPEAVAVVFNDTSLSYRELNSKADRVAGHLRSLGVAGSVIVGLGVERSFEMIIGALGILKAGGVYWGLEENLPEPRLRQMLAEAQPCVLLVSKKSVAVNSKITSQAGIDSPAVAVAVVAIEDLLEFPPGNPISSTLPIWPVDPAYVSYTSGSMGRPNGVVVPHRAVVRLVKGVDYVSLDAGETLLHLSPLSFDASTFELWGALLNGGRLVLHGPGLPTLAEIGDAIRRHGVTTLWLTAGLFHLMVEERLDDLKPLRQLLAGGDTLSPEHVRKARRALPGCRIINGYGPTENTTFTCCYTVGEERDIFPSVPIGRPIANSRVFVLDAQRRPVPVGVPGELYAGGDGVACGYLCQPQLTAERFIPDPFSSGAESRLYRTGDRVRWRPDGNLEFLGRLDAQVKIRGRRVELREVEVVLGSQPEVRQGIVVAREGMPGDKQLVAYLVPRNGEQPGASVLRARLAEGLPEYMIPSCFVWLDRLPLTPGGKIDRQALPAPELCGTGASQDGGPPANLLELKLICLWQRLLGRNDIDRDDNFFALGGDSLLTIGLLAEIETTLGAKLSMAGFIQSPTVESLARRLTEEKWAPPWSSLAPLQPLGAKPPLFFVHGVSGDVYLYLQLTRLLPPDQPSYGIQAVGLDGKSPRHTSVEEMASHYVKEIASFQPEGAIYLTGYSLAGVIAFEVAQQLHRLGRRVALLALIGSEPGVAPWTFFGLKLPTYLPKRILFHLRNWWRLPGRERLGYIMGRWETIRGVLSPTDYFHSIALSYRLRRYPGSAVVFVGDDFPVGWRCYWRHLVRGGVSFRRVPCVHLEMLSPIFLPGLAKSLIEAMEDARKDESPAQGGRPRM